MSIGASSAASGLAGSAAGAPLSQAKGSEVARAAQDVRNRERRVEQDTKAADAAGIGQADGEDHETSERDADGRRLFEGQPTPGITETPPPDPEADPPRGRDATGMSGTQLDLSG